VLKVPLNTNQSIFGAE